MSRDEVAALIGPSAERGTFANGTSAWTYRYFDYGVVKLEHVVFDAAGRLLWHYSVWDPNKYSKKSGSKFGGR
jgi:hypothetical protein